MKEIQLTQGKVALVDDDDYDYLNQWKWFCSSNGYAGRNGRAGEKPAILMHRVIANTPDGKCTDHINCNQLDNRRCNLRTCTSSQNMANSEKWSHNTSGIKGVGPWRLTGRWRAYIKVKQKYIHLGYYETKDDAAKAYKDASIKYFGQFAYNAER